jgi:hypothetical protein|tara:strand:- start:3730 stop:4137 length:408 start_codon:yes stop_codon:yes gene_type:complete
MAVKANEPVLGKLGAGVVTAVTGGISILLISTAFNAPTRNLERAEKGFEEQRIKHIAISEEITTLEQRVTALAKLVGELGIKVEQGTGDRYTGTQARLVGTTTSVIQSYNDREHHRLDEEVESLRILISGYHAGK